MNAKENWTATLPTREEQRAIMGIHRPEAVLGELESALLTSFGLSDPYILEVILSTVATVEMPGDPLWFFLVGPPSGMKTEMLRWFRIAEDRVYTLSSLTPHSLITGLEKGHDLLPELDEKVLVIKDFSTILETRRESREQIFAQLRDSFDGYAENYYGTVGRKSFHARFNLLAAVTGAIERYYSVQSWLGQRFLIARVPEVDGFEKALDASGREEDLREQFSDLVLRLLESLDFDAWKNVETTRVKKLRPAVEFVAQARAHVPRDGYSNIRAHPEPERTPRLIKQLNKLCVGRAMIHGRAEVIEEDLEFARRVALDTIPSLRQTALLAFREGPLPVDDLARILRLPSSTTYRLRDDLVVLGLIRIYPSDGKPVLYELEDGILQVMAQDAGSAAADAPLEKTTSRQVAQPVAKDERVLARVLQNQGFGVCDTCHQTVHDILQVRPRGSDTTRNVCGRCGEARFDFEPPPRHGDPAYA